MNQLTYHVTSSEPTLPIGRDVTLTLTITPPSGGSDCQAAYFMFYIGDDAKCFAKDDSTLTISLSNAKWKIAHKYSEEDANMYICNLMHDGTKVETATQIYIRFQTNQTVGAATFAVYDDKTDKRVFSFTKTVAQFYLRNFIARATDAANIPKTEFHNGGAIYFSWESNADYYELYDGRSDTPLKTENTDVFIPNGISRDTTFILAAKKKSLSQNDIELVLYDKLALTVLDADLSVKSLIASDFVESHSVNGGEAHINNLYTCNLNCDATAENEISINSPIIFAKPLTIKSDCSISGNLNIVNENSNCGIKGNVEMLGGTLHLKSKSKMVLDDSSSLSTFNCQDSLKYGGLAGDWITVDNTTQSISKNYTIECNGIVFGQLFAFNGGGSCSDDFKMVCDIYDTNFKNSAGWAGQITASLVVTKQNNVQTFSLPVYAGCNLAVDLKIISGTTDWNQCFSMNIIPFGNCYQPSPITFHNQQMNYENHEHGLYEKRGNPTIVNT